MKGEKEKLQELKHIVLSDTQISLRTSNKIVKILNEAIRRTK